jgi:predicted CopG family antitoxin
MAFTTIQLDKDTLEELKKVKQYPKQSYNELIKKMISLTRSINENNQYDEFLHKVQQQKMQELWDNKHDEVWENV